jgi:hypothetical protein
MAIFGMFHHDGLTGYARGVLARLSAALLRHQARGARLCRLWGPGRLTADGFVGFFQRLCQSEPQLDHMSLLTIMGYTTSVIPGKLYGYPSLRTSTPFARVESGAIPDVLCRGGGPRQLLPSSPPSRSASSPL